MAGVIAISNILLITVKERTKRNRHPKSFLGAKPSEVRNQILLESVAITLTSGLLGFIFEFSFDDYQCDDSKPRCFPIL